MGEYIIDGRGDGYAMAVNEDGSLNVSSVSHTSTDLEGLGRVTVGTTAIELTFSGTTEEITITAVIENTGVIYIGKSDVLSDGSNAAYPIYPGVPFSKDYNDTDNPLYIVASEEDQVVVVGAGK